jgi:flavin reductase (DIM6/NTAB) family NADH-FMN oxidoreductase RutF
MIEQPAGMQDFSLRQIMRQWASGVSLVTVAQDLRLHGMTVNSFTSVSLEPSLILVSLERTTRTFGMVSRLGRFAVAILAEDQRQLAERFGGLVGDDLNRFEGIAHVFTPGGMPIPEGCLAYLDCHIYSSLEAGTHVILIGEVENGMVLRDAPPLLYFNRSFPRLGA